MAVYVLLLKEYEYEDKVIYKYGPSEEVTGKIEYNKKSNKFVELESIKQENISNEFFFKRAAQKLAVIIVKEKGVFPERTSIEA